MASRSPPASLPNRSQTTITTATIAAGITNNCTMNPADGGSTGGKSPGRSFEAGSRGAESSVKGDMREAVLSELRGDPEGTLLRDRGRLGGGQGVRPRTAEGRKTISPW